MALRVLRCLHVTENNQQDEVCMLCNVCQNLSSQMDLMMHVAYFITSETRIAMQFLAYESTKIVHTKDREKQKCWKC
jgi:hypothetical protein